MTEEQDQRWPCPSGAWEGRKNGITPRVLINYGFFPGSAYAYRAFPDSRGDPGCSAGTPCSIPGFSQPHPAWRRTLPGIQGQPGGAGDVPGCSSAFLPHPDPGIPRCLPQVCFPKASSRHHLAPESRRWLFLGRQRGRQSRHVAGIALPDPGVAFGVSRSAFRDSGSLRLCRLLFYPSEQSPGFPGTRSRRSLGFGAPLWPWQGGTVDIPVGYSQPLFWLPAFGGFSRSRALFQPGFPAGFRFPAPCERRQRAPCQVLRSAACFKMEAGRNPFSWRRCRPLGIRDSAFPAIWRAARGSGNRPRRKRRIPFIRPARPGGIWAQDSLRNGRSPAGIPGKLQEAPPD